MEELNALAAKKKKPRTSKPLPPPDRRQLIIDAIERRKKKKAMETIVVSAPKVPNKYFPTKAAYLAFRAAWSKFIAGGGKTTAAQHLLYNVLRECDQKKGFTPVTNKIKLANGAYPWYSYQQSFWHLTYWVKMWAESPDKKDYWGKGYKEHLDAFLAPFGQTVTGEILLTALKDIK